MQTREMAGHDEILALVVEVARRHTVGGVLRTIVDGLMAVGRGEKPLRAAVWVADPDRPDGPLIPGAVAGAEGRGEEPLIARATASGRYAFITDEDDWDDYGGYPAWAAREGVVGYAALPMTYRDQRVGVLSLQTASSLDALMTDPFTALQAVADHGAACIANARASEHLRQVAARLDQENGHLRGDVLRLGGFGEVLGDSPAVRKCLAQIELAAQTTAPVLIRGEVGTGKELMARVIHDGSDRGRGQFIAVSCASIPPARIEGELFDTPAAGGTLFLKDVDALPPEVQQRLHGVLGDGRPGTDVARATDLRLLASTTHDLRKGSSGGRFHEGLYHRISVMCLDVPPLRDRRDDVAVLAGAFLRRTCERLRLPHRTLAPEEIDRLAAYDWPGNAGELKAVIEIAATPMVAGRPLDIVLPDGGTRVGSQTPSAPILTDAEFRRRERENLLAALGEADWKVAGRRGAAARLGIKATTLSARMRVMGIRKPPRGGGRSA
jgi:transcriptional regulator with GAF, ATPase, and Fis domain